LTYNSGFPNCIPESLEISGVNDRAGNTIVMTTEPYMYCMAGAANFKGVIINEIYADPNPSPDPLNCGIPGPGSEAEYVELYNRSGAPVDLMNWSIISGTSLETITTSTYILQPGSYVALTEDSAWIPFGPTIIMGSLPTLSNTSDSLSIRDENFNLVDTMAYVGTDWDPGSNNGVSLELVDPSDTCSTSGNWTASTDSCRTTYAAQNSVYNPGASAAPPTIVSLTVLANNTLRICFDESVEPIQASNPSLYGLNSAPTTPTTAQPVAPDFTCVDLIFGAAFNTGQLYWLTADGVPDCGGNADSSGASFILPSPAQPGDVIFNEVMWELDVNAGLSVPQHEYVELYNRSNNIFDLANWTFSDAGTPRILDSYLLYPDSFVVLIDDSDTADFAGLPVLVLSSMPGFSDNTGDKIGLRDFNGTLVDTLEFDNDTYQDTDRDDGGYSLELINPEDTCKTFGNWMAHQGVPGGTPGAQNSVYNPTNDAVNPLLVGATVIAPDTIEICFNETMNAGFLSDPANYSIDNLIGTPVSATVIAPNLACVHLALADTVMIGTIYTVTFSNLEDCNGNPLDDPNATFVQGGPAVPGQIIINEIMADAEPAVDTLPEEKYIELYNKGTTVVDLTGFQITDRPASPSNYATLDAYNLFPGEYVILCANSDVPDFERIGPTLGVSSFPDPNISFDSLELYDPSMVLMDRVFYTDDWYQDEEREGDGYSLERINPCAGCMSPLQWRASQNAQGGTPGAENSVVDTTFFESDPPSITGVEILNAQAIRINFDEIMDRDELLDSTHYLIDNGIRRPSMIFQLDLLPTSVDLILPVNMDTNTVYCILITGLTDCQGNL
ncbi:MAG: lamin tail domain-containing protein, partial [Bacteroidota bacterium]